MGFQKGHKKLGGRQKGTGNKRVPVKEMLEQMGVDPFAIMAEMASKIGLYEEGIRFAAAKELCKYIEPQLKSVEVKNAEGDVFRVVIEDYSTKDKK